MPATMPRMKFAYFVFPHLGGTFTVFQQLRLGLAQYGIDVQWVALGDEARRSLAKPEWAEERSTGFTLEAENEPRRQVASLIRAMDERDFDGVFVNVVGDTVLSNAVRYMPPHISRILIVHNITPGVYAAARALRDSVHATVGVSPRIRDDLIGRHGFDPNFTVCIPNAVDLAKAAPARSPPQPGHLRMLSLGRIEDQAKGVFLLPDILSRLPERVGLTVAGDGPDLQELKNRCARFGGRVRFLGAVTPERAASLYASHDILIGPSRFEGFMITLVEAMSAGCVPVASFIKGVTDEVVEDGMTGLLFPVGHTRKASEAIRHLHSNPQILERMSNAARATVPIKFRVGDMGAGYMALIERVALLHPPVAPPLDLDRWSLPAGLRPGLRTYIPLPIKNFLRIVRERVA